MKRFLKWLLCPCKPKDRTHVDGPWEGWGKSTCSSCGRSWLHFRDLALPVR